MKFSKSHFKSPGPDAHCFLSINMPFQSFTQLHGSANKSLGQPAKLHINYFSPEHRFQVESKPDFMWFDRGIDYLFNHLGGQNLVLINLGINRLQQFLFDFREMLYQHLLIL